MNKKINLNKNTYVLFVLNVILFVTTIFFKSLYTKLAYNIVLVNVVFLINILLFIFGIIFNVLFEELYKQYGALYKQLKKYYGRSKLISDTGLEVLMKDEELQ